MDTLLLQISSISVSVKMPSFEKQKHEVFILTELTVISQLFVRLVLHVTSTQNRSFCEMSIATT